MKDIWAYIKNKFSRRWKDIRRFSGRRQLRRLARSPQFPEVNSGDSHVLFFTPEAAVESHYATTSLVAKTLQQRGHRVLVTQCYQQFDRCTVVDMHNLSAADAEKRRDDNCRQCALSSIEVLRQYQLPALELGAFHTPEIQQTVAQAMDSAPRNLLDFQFDGIEFGKLSCVMVSLTMKRSDYENFVGDDRRIWMDYIAAALRSYLIVDNILKQVPIKTLVYFNDYAMMIAARLAGKKHGIPTCTMSLGYHCNVDRRKLGFYSDVTSIHINRIVTQWPQWRSISMGPDRIRDVGDDIAYRLGGKGHTVYSPKRSFASQNILQQLGLSSNKKTIVCYTSSKDEILACRLMMEGSKADIPIQSPQPFGDQTEYFSALVEYVKQHEDWQLVVRVHPREGANSRNPRDSEHLGQLRSTFETLPDNCRFIWPHDSISSYDLAELADLVLVSWSSIGLEIARMGAPVLAAYNPVECPYPCDDFIRCAETKEEYFSLVQSMLDRPPSLETTLRAFRWHNLRHIETTLDFGDVIPDAHAIGLPKFAVSQQEEALEQVILHGREVMDINLERRRQLQSPAYAESEWEAFLTQLHRIIHLLCTGEDRQFNERLVAASVTDLSQKPPSAAPHLFYRDCEIAYHQGGNIYRRYSPMIARLARNCAIESSENKKAA